MCIFISSFNFSFIGVVIGMCLRKKKSWKSHGTQAQAQEDEKEEKELRKKFTTAFSDEVEKRKKLEKLDCEIFEIPRVNLLCAARDFQLESEMVKETESHTE